MTRFYRLLRMLGIVLLILVVLFEVGRRFLVSGLRSQAGGDPSDAGCR